MARPPSPPCSSPSSSQRRPPQAADPPRVVRETIEWLDVWVPGNNVTDRPRVLLVGDSITRDYYKAVEDKLQGKAVVCRLATSKSLGDPALLDEVRLVLGQAKFDVVHFNNGMHGWGYTEDEYAKAVPDLVAAIRKAAPGAKLVWASTTPVRVARTSRSTRPEDRPGEGPERGRRGGDEAGEHSGERPVRARGREARVVFERRCPPERERLGRPG